MTHNFNSDDNQDHGERRVQHNGRRSADPTDWHLDKTVSITQIGALVLVIISGTMWFMDQDKRINLNSVYIEEAKSRIRSETEARQAADLLLAERLNRYETDQIRVVERIFNHIDKIYNILRDERERHTK